jgi:hypothetical protein
MVMSPRPTNETTPRRDRLTPRVLRRHLGVAAESAREVGFTTRSESFSVIYSDGGVITSEDLKRLLKERLGPLRDLRFLSPREGANIARWFAVTDAGEFIGGKLVLHARMRGDRVVSWAQIRVEPVPRHGKAVRATGPRARLEDIAARAREIIRNVRERPTYGPVELCASLAALVDLAEEQDTDDEGQH